MNPKSGSACTSVDPTAPDEAIAADEADPGKVAKVKAEQIEKKKGKYGSTPAKPFKPVDPDSASDVATSESTEEEEKKSWIEIELVDEESKPIPGEKYEITLPDKTVAKGTLDAMGLARIDGIKPGTCQITFPDLDKSAWSKA